jgi:NAD(P)H-dependent flavin oxidoreductase YrpB (nitropropane dioxygenase family)
MNVAAGPELAAAVTNAGGLGVIGGVGYTPKVLRSQVGLTGYYRTERRGLTHFLSLDSRTEGAP